MTEMDFSSPYKWNILKMVLTVSIAMLLKRHQGVVAAKIPVYIGGFFPLSPNKASVPGHALLAAAQLAIKHVNESDILNGYELRMIIKDSKCDPAYSANMFMDLMLDKRPVVMVLGAACSDVTELLAELSAYRNLAQISYASRSLALSNRKKYPTLFRTLPSESARNLARVEWIKHFGWKNIALLYENTGGDLASQSNHQVIEELKKLNCSIVLSEQTNVKQLDINMKMLLRNDARIIVGTFYERQARFIFCQAYKSGLYGPRYVWLLIGTYSHRWWAVQDKNLQCTLEQMKKAIAYSFIFNNQIFLGDDEQGNARRAISGVTRTEYHKQYITYLTSLNITKPPNITAYTYDAVWVIAVALNQSLPFMNGNKQVYQNASYQDPKMTKLFVSTIQKIHFEGITGEVAFFEDGDRYDGVVEILQHDSDGQAVPVGFYYPKERKLTLLEKGNVWPDHVSSPRVSILCLTVVHEKTHEYGFTLNKESYSLGNDTWYEMGGKRPIDRTVVVKEFVKIPLWLYAFVCMLSSLGIVLGLVFLAFNVKFRHKRYIKLSSPNLNNVIILGCIMVYSTIFLYGLDGRVSDKAYSLACRARYSLLSLGFTVGFGAMFSKTWRVHQIFISNVKRVKKVVRDKELFSLLAVIVCIDVFLLILWMALHPPSRHVIVINGIRRISRDRDYEIVLCREECRGPHSLPWLVTFYAFHSLLLVFGLFLAFETRKVSVPVLNDSKFIGISVYNVVLLCAIGVPLSHVSSSEPAAGFTLICAVILFCTTVTLSVLFIPKVMQMWKDPDGNPLQGTMLSTRGHHAREASTSLATCDNFTERHAKLEAEIIMLKQENHKLKSKLSIINKEEPSNDTLVENLSPVDIHKKYPSRIGHRQKSLRYVFAKKQDQNDSTKTNEDEKTTTEKNPVKSLHNVSVQKRTGKRDPDLTKQDNTAENQSSLRERSLTNSSVLKENTDHHEPKRSNSLPSSSIHSVNHLRVLVQTPERKEGKKEYDDGFELQQKKSLKNGNLDAVVNGRDSKKRTPCTEKTNCQGGHDKKANGYGLRVYCVKTTC